jgi:hypothetical protein
LGGREFEDFQSVDPAIAGTSLQSNDIGKLDSFVLLSSFRTHEVASRSAKLVAVPDA